MKNLLFFLFAFGLLSAEIACQVTDTVQVKHFKYNFVTGNFRIVYFTEQQFQARPDYLTGFNLVEAGKFSEAIEPLKNAIGIDSTGNCTSGENGMAHSELGYAYLRMKDYNNAFHYLDKAIEINKQLANPYLNKVVGFMELGKNESAIELLNTAIDLIPEDAMFYVQRGYLFQDIGKDDFALIDFYKFLELMEKQDQMKNSKPLIDDIKKNIQKIENKIKE